MQRSSASSVTDTISFDGYTETSISGGATTSIRYYSAGGQRIAMRQGTPGTPGTIYWNLLADNLGSETVTLDANGSTQAVQLFAPYGAVRYSQGTMPTSYNFTSQRLDSQTGLLYYNFRYYDPVSGRFTRSDTVQTNAGGMDPYAYVGDNPETRTDPTGHDGSWWQTALMFTAIAVVVAVVVVAVVLAAPVVLMAAATAAEVAGTAVAAGEVAGAAATATAVGVAAESEAENVAATAAESAATTAETASTVGDTAASDTPGGTTPEACSFTPATKVATTHGEQAIGTLHSGEKVLAYNPRTKRMEYEPILHVWMHTDNDLVDLTITSKVHAPHSAAVTQTSEVIHTNQKHPFFTEEKGFVPVAQLRLGMHLLQANGHDGVLTGWKVEPGAAVMYNLTVAQDHTFTVGAGQWVVHNCGRQSGDIVDYGDKATGFQNHHGVMDAWAKNNISGYISRATDGPSMALTEAEHDATRTVFRQWLYEQTGKFVGAAVDWTNVSARDIFGLSERMFDAAGVADEARQLYYRAFNQYIYTGFWNF